jgi:hypothetical protein
MGLQWTFKTTAELVSLANVKLILQSLPLGKAAGPDNIPAELLAKGGENVATIFTSFLQLVHSSKTIPSEWRKAMIVPIYKRKGLDTDIANHRPIALTCTARRLYERLLMLEVKPLARKLCDSQGGFRANRSTLDQAMVLHETLNEIPTAVTALLDLKAAYDLVNRNILWDELYSVFGFTVDMLDRLKNLFDFNSSELVVAGRKSNPIPNTRGLLQGSSLSPILFNFFIDGLCRRLAHQNAPTIAVHGVRLNSLLFADDTALVAGNQRDLATLLGICEKWSQDVGMQFAPAKCVILGPPAPQREVSLQLYNTDLPSEEQAKYLGIPFTKKGIAWSKLAQERATKARGVIAMLAPVGMNALGWAPAASCIIYKTFIRPVLEYGLALSAPSAANLKIYRKVQTLALRTICTAPKTTSIAALHRLLQVEPMEHRARELNLNWGARMHNSQDATVLAARVWRGGLQGERGRNAHSLPKHTTRTNTLWLVPQAKLINHSTAKMTRENDAKPPLALTYNARIVLRKQAICGLEAGTEGVAGAVQVEMQDGLRSYLLANSGISRKDRKLVMMWTLGAITRHEDCRNCQETLTRVHAVTCSGAGALLEAKFPDIPPPAIPRHTRLDSVLNFHRNTKPSTSRVFQICVTAIKKILTKCRGLQLNQDGTWEDPLANLQPPAPPQPRVRTAAAIAQTLRNARIAVERNRTLGRPRGRGGRAGVG